MAQDISTLLRAEVLTNSAAEFLETRADKALGSELTGPDGPEYVPEEDRFLSKRDIKEIDYFAESAQKKEQLKKTLSSFVQTLKDRKFDKKLSVTLKEPDKYNMGDVLDIAGKIQERHCNAANVKSSTGVIRKCFRSAGKYVGVMKKLASLVPDDVYGSVISGGFTLILGAIERAETLRGDICEALADIPRKLAEVEDLRTVHYRSAELKRCADSVFVAVFLALERIVNELSKSMGRKGLALVFSGDKYGSEVTEALEDLDKRVKEFKSRADICSQQRLGRMEKTGIRARIAAENTELAVTGIVGRMEHSLGRMEEEMKSFMSSRTVLDSASVEEIRHGLLLANVYNKLYGLFSSSPLFDSHTGGIDRFQWLLQQSQYQQQQSQIAFPPNPGNLASQHGKRNKRLIAKWLKRLQPAYLSVSEDLDECLQSFARSSLAFKDKVQWLVTSDEIGDWLRAPGPQILIVEPEIHPEDIENELSFTSAFLMKLLVSQDYPVVGYFCRLRANESMNLDVAGPQAMERSIFAQLLTEIRKKRPDLDLSALECHRHQRRAIDVTYIGAKLRSLLNLLPKGDCVFLILDSAGFLSASESENSQAIGLLLDTASNENVVVKIFVTELQSNGPIEGRDVTTLLLPGFVDGGGQDINPAFFEEDSLQALRDFQAQQVDEQESEEDTSEEQSDVSENFAWH